MNKKTINIINSVLIIVQLVLAIVYDRLSNPYVFKSLATGWFLVVAVFNIIIAHKNNNSPKLYRMFMLIGLIFAAGGDIFLIEPNTFVLGAGLFAVGHILYICAFTSLKKIRWLDVVLFAIIFGAGCLIIFLYNGFNFNGMLPLIVIYALIISAMLAKAIGNCIKELYCKQNIFIAIGALLFYISDVCLLFYFFAGAPVWVDTICLFTYYTGQALLASSIFFINQSKM